MLWLAPLLLLLLAGCGFKPLYGEAGQTAAPELQETFADIRIETPEDRLGQYVRNRLIGELSPRGLPAAPRYALKIEMAEAVEGYAFRSDRAITRERVELSALIVLVDLQTSELLMSETARATASYDVVQSDFAAVSARRDARQRAGNQIATAVVARLALYFREGSR